MHQVTRFCTLARGWSHKSTNEKQQMTLSTSLNRPTLCTATLKYRAIRVILKRPVSRARPRCRHIHTRRDSGTHSCRDARTKTVLGHGEDSHRRKTQDKLIMYSVGRPANTWSIIPSRNLIDCNTLLNHQLVSFWNIGCESMVSAFLDEWNCKYVQ